MNFKQILQLVNGETIKVGNKNNQIYYDSDNKCFVVELFEFTDENQEDMFSVADGFKDIEIAIKVANDYTSENYKHQK